MREQGRRQAEDRRRSRQQLTQNITLHVLLFPLFYVLPEVSFTSSSSIIFSHQISPP